MCILSDRFSSACYLSKRICFCHYTLTSAKWSDLRLYSSDIPWNDNYFHARDPFVCAQRITEVVVSGTETHIYSAHFSTHKVESVDATWYPDLALIKAARHVTEDTVSIHLLKLMRFIILYGIQICSTRQIFFHWWQVSEYCPLLFFSWFWYLSRNNSNDFSCSYLPSLLNLEAPLISHSVSKAELLAEGFVKNSTFEESEFLQPSPKSSD